MPPFLFETDGIKVALVVSYWSLTLAVPSRLRPIKRPWEHHHLAPHLSTPSVPSLLHRDVAPASSSSRRLSPPSPRDLHSPTVKIPIVSSLYFHNQIELSSSGALDAELSAARELDVESPRCHDLLRRISNASPLPGAPLSTSHRQIFMMRIRKRVVI
jgi:hypothetical protein